MTKLKAWQYLLGMCLLLCAMQGCDPNSADVVAPAAKVANLQFSNLIPDLGDINIYINGTRQNSSKLNYGDFSGYNSVASGNMNISFETDNLHTLISSAEFKLDTTFKTTLFVTGKTSAVTVIKTMDTAVVDTKSYKPKLRFVQASADAPALDLVVNGVTIANQAFKSISAFSRVDTGKVNFKVVVNGTGTVLYNNPIPLTANSVYTFYTYGSYLGSSLTLGKRTDH